MNMAVNADGAWSKAQAIAVEVVDYTKKSPEASAWSERQVRLPN